MVSERWVIKKGDAYWTSDVRLSTWTQNKCDAHRFDSRRKAHWSIGMFPPHVDDDPSPRIVRLRPKAPVKPLTSPVSPEDVDKIVAALNADIHDYAKWAATCFVEREKEIRKAERERIARLFSEKPGEPASTNYVSIGERELNVVVTKDVARNIRLFICAATWPPPPEPKTGEMK